MSQNWFEGLSQLVVVACYTRQDVGIPGMVAKVVEVSEEAKNNMLMIQRMPSGSFFLLLLSTLLLNLLYWLLSFTLIAICRRAGIDMRIHPSTLGFLTPLVSKSMAQNRHYHHHYLLQSPNFYYLFLTPLRVLQKVPMLPRLLFMKRWPEIGNELYTPRTNWERTWKGWQGGTTGCRGAVEILTRNPKKGSFRVLCLWWFLGWCFWFS